MEEIRQIIRAELRALFEGVTFDNNKNYTIPDNVATTCQKALDVVEANNLTDTNTSRGSGKQKAKDLAEKKTQSHAQMKNLKSFFETNKEEYRLAIIKGLTIHNSGAVQSFELHGGVAGRNWCKHKIKMTKNSNLMTKKTLRNLGSGGEGTGLGIFAGTDMISTTNHRTHR